MSLQSQIEEKLNISLKNKDKKIYPTLRLVVSALKDALIVKRVKDSKPLTDQEVTTVLKKMVKQRTESYEVYKKAGRDELSKKEQNEIEIISSFLPKQLNADETKKICEEAIKKLNASSIKDMGKVMGEIKKNYPDSIDFALAGSEIKKILNK